MCTENRGIIVRRIASCLNKTNSEHRIHDEQFGVTKRLEKRCGSGSLLRDLKPFKFLILSAEDKRITCYITCYRSSFHSLLGKDEMMNEMHGLIHKERRVKLVFQKV